MPRTESLEDLSLKWLASHRIGTVIDVGANTGQFAERALEAFPACRIFAFEPLAQEAAALKSRFSSQSAVAIFEVALGDSSEPLPFYRNEYSPSSSALEMAVLHKAHFPFTFQSEKIVVKQRRMDDVLSGEAWEGPTLLKIDVQGFAGRVLAGAVETLARCEFALIEADLVPLYRDQTDFLDLCATMRQRGFVYRGNFSQLYSPRNGEILSVDALFARPGEHS